MRPSPKRHTLAVLRLIIGLTQKEMADLCECSTATIQAIELGKLKMSLTFADNVTNKTNVQLDWLMRNNVNAPPVDGYGKPYTLELFEEWRALLFNPPRDFTDFMRRKIYTRACFDNALRQLASLFTHAYQHDRVEICNYKLNHQFDDLFLSGTIFDLKKVPQEEKDQWFESSFSPIETHTTAIVQQFYKDTETIFKTLSAGHKSPIKKTSAPVIPHQAHPTKTTTTSGRKKSSKSKA